MNTFYKKLSMLLLIIATGCNAQTNKEVKEVVFNAHTRGRSESITVVNYNVFYKTQQSSKTYFINADKRKKMEEIIAKIDLSIIGDLKAPSSKRFFDGAMHTEVSIKVGNKLYTSTTFDDDNPPEALKPLVILLKSFLK